MFMSRQLQRPQNKNIKTFREKQLTIVESENIKTNRNGETSSITKHKNQSQYQRQEMPQDQSSFSHKKKRAKSLNPDSQYARARLLNNIVDKIRETKRSNLGTINITEQNIQEKLEKLEMLLKQVPQNRGDYSSSKFQSSRSQKIDITEFLNNINEMPGVTTNVTPQGQTYGYDFSRKGLKTEDPIYNSYGSNKKIILPPPSQSNADTFNIQSLKQPKLEHEHHHGKHQPPLLSSKKLAEIYKDAPLNNQAYSSNKYKNLFIKNKIGNNEPTTLQAINNRLSDRSRSSNPNIKFTYLSPRAKKNERQEFPKTQAHISPKYRPPSMQASQTFNLMSNQGDSKAYSGSVASQSRQDSEFKLGFNLHKNNKKGDRRFTDACPLCGRSCGCAPTKK